jgi:hypothetical protein
LLVRPSSTITMLHLHNQYSLSSLTALAEDFEPIRFFSQGSIDLVYYCEGACSLNGVVMLPMYSQPSFSEVFSQLKCLESQCSVFRILCFERNRVEQPDVTIMTACKLQWESDDVKLWSLGVTTAG